MSDLSPMLNRLAVAAELAPAGYALAFHIRFMAPTFLLQTYPREWTKYYSVHALVMSDPTVAWGFANEGSCRWSALTDDPARVMDRAADHGLTYGVVCATDANGSRSFGGFARADREFTDDEIARLMDVLTDLHRSTTAIDNLSPQQVKRLSDMAINYAKG